MVGTATTLYLFPEQRFVDLHVAHYLVLYSILITGALLAAALLGPQHTGFVRLIGRHSMLAYCLHVELVFGSTSGILHHRLGLPLFLACTAYVVLLIAGLAVSMERRKAAAALARREETLKVERPRSPLLVAELAVAERRIHALAERDAVR